MTLPKRKTKNEAIGVKRCGCGDVMTIHRAAGTRAGTLYSICDKCGVDQRNGDAPQAFFADHVDSLEALAASEAAPALGQETETGGETGAEIMAVEAANDDEMMATEAETEGKTGAAPFALVAAIVGGLVGLLALAAKLKETPQT
ncbi:hypothetical protein BZG76_06065 [Salinivibrio sp. AR647]|uniref:hypothetical protein n=1 Tax=Salinivibrio sp. AR647 TaxID=1909438 RepID=UPI0009866F2A|nr:hypothetical protein [Salinivibrio sp. AR647]OOE92846.1 hypothetical protein BZG76_06065 [Salinivibrio sp. AR647]